MFRSPAYLSSYNRFDDDLDRIAYDSSFPSSYPYYPEYSNHPNSQPQLTDIPVYESIPRIHERFPVVYPYPTFPYLRPNNPSPFSTREALGYRQIHTPVKGDRFVPSSNEHSSPRILHSNTHPCNQCRYTRASYDRCAHHTGPVERPVENESTQSPYLEYLIDVRSVINGQNKRLTVMLRNVPNRYTPADLKKVLDRFIYKKYQIVTFPNDSKTHRNLGYAFISLDDNSALLTLYRHMHNEYWPNSNNQKVCRICHSIDKKNKK